jgi:6-phosphogluconolactonase
VNRRDALRVFADPAALARHVAGWMTGLACAKDDGFKVALSGGSTPRMLYRTLAGAFADEFPWPRIDWYWGDERFVPHDDEQSNYRMAYDAMLSFAPPARIHPVPTSSLTAAQSALAYEHTLQRAYGADRLDPARPLFDLVLLGLGTDGHTASLFPGSSALSERVHWTAGVEMLQPARVTLTYPALESCACAAFLVTGIEKRDALRGLLDGDPALPAARFNPRGDLHIFADRAAAG